MNDGSAGSHPPGRYRLRTFGTLALATPDDTAFSATHGKQRRRLGLLAVLAAAGEQGRSRDQLLLLFWPDATQARARHSLEQLLYAIRTSMGETVFTGSNPIRLNADVVSSDVGEFHAALESGDLERGVQVYRGPFLDGFYLGDAPEFEQWADAERARLERSYSSALERLAGDAEAAGDHAGAVKWWRKLSDADPVSSRNATGLIRALMNAGDHAAALQYAEQYERAVSRELGTSVGPGVASLVADIRAKSQNATIAVSKSAPSPPHVPRLHEEAGTEAVGTPLASRNVDRPPSPVLTRRFLPYLVAVIVLTAAAAITWLRPSGGPPAAAEPERSIAVLPLGNLGGDDRDAPIVEGLTEELIAVLTRIPGLRVIGRTSTAAFRQSDSRVQAIADSLGVSYILEGSVQKAGTDLRVRMRLVGAGNGSTLWSETYHRQLRDVFEVQDDIAKSVARELGLRLGVASDVPLRREPTQNIAAYELYLRGSDRALLRSDSAARVGLGYFRQAVELDSTYAGAWAGLARMHVRVSEGRTADREGSITSGELAARRALALDDSLAEAHASLGVVRMARFDFNSAYDHMTRAVTLDPHSARFREWLVSVAVWVGRPVEALAQAERALELEPVSPYARAEVARALFVNDRCDEALAHLERLSRLEPPMLRVGLLTTLCLTRKQMWREAIASHRPGSGIRLHASNGLTGFILARSGDTREARRIEAALLDQSRSGNAVAFDLAILYAGLEDPAQAVTWLNRAIDDLSLSGAPGGSVVVMGPLFEDVRRHPGFERFSRRLGIQKR